MGKKFVAGSGLSVCRRGQNKEEQHKPRSC
jgi:hypothetical protein